MSKMRYKIGDIFAIPIDNNYFAFGRLLKDASIAIYDLISESIVEVDELRTKKVLFESGVFYSLTNDGEWKIIGNIPFANEEDSWPSPVYIRDIINPNEYRIYYKGEMKTVSYADIVGLDKQVMRKPEELVSEIKKRMRL